MVATDARDLGSWNALSQLVLALFDSCFKNEANQWFAIEHVLESLKYCKRVYNLQSISILACLPDELL